VSPLLLITAAVAPDAILRGLEAALTREAEGRIWVQLRAKHCPARTQYELAERARELCHTRGARLIINDRIDIALSVGADGVHLPELGLPLTAAHRLLGDAAWIGVSCHDRDGLARAARDGASFATLSPVFATPDKGAPLGVEQFGALTRAANLPVYALGGIRPEHIPQLIDAGAAGVAAISAVFGADDPGARVQAFLTAWQRALNDRPLGAATATDRS